MGGRPSLGTMLMRRGPVVISTHCAGPFMPSRNGITSKDVGLCMRDSSGLLIHSRIDMPC